MKTLILLCLISTGFCMKKDSKEETIKTKRGIFHRNYFDGGLGYGLAPALFHLAPAPHRIPFVPATPVVTKQIPVAVPVPVERHIPVHVKVPVPVPVAVERHVPVHVPVPVTVPYPVEKHVPVLVDRPVIKHIPIDRPLPVPVPHAVPVPVPQPYPVFVHRVVPPVFQTPVAQPTVPAFVGAVSNSGLIPNGFSPVPVPVPVAPKEVPASSGSPTSVHPGFYHHSSISPSTGYPVLSHHTQYREYDVEQYDDLRKDHRLSSIPYSYKPSPYRSARIYRHYPKHSHHRTW